MHETQKNICFGVDSGGCRFAVRLRRYRGCACRCIGMYLWRRPIRMHLLRQLLRIELSARAGYACA